MKKSPAKVFSVKKPWGEFTQYTHNQPVTVKIIAVKKGGVLSLQMHRKRDELWIPLDSGLIAQVGGKKTKCVVGQKIFVPRQTKHRMSATKTARFLEISFGEFDENDIVRFEDKYGRVKNV